jgi:hypothetical protein
MNVRIYFLTVAFLPAACQTPANPPSLLPRAIERAQTGAATFPSHVVARPADAILVAQLARILADARTGETDFISVEQTNAAVLAGPANANQGSEAWILAEMARSALEASRQNSANALAEIDSLLVARTEQASRDAATAGLDEILSVQAEISAIVERQTERLKNVSR